MTSPNDLTPAQFIDQARVVFRYRAAYRRSFLRQDGPEATAADICQHIAVDDRSHDAVFGMVCHWWGLEFPTTLDAQD